MTSTPDRRGRGKVLAAALLLACGAGAGQAADGLAANYVAQAHAALDRGDGIAAEMALRKALAAGMGREAVAARMGEALLAQGDLAKARAWLGPARFSPAEAPHGYRVLGRLEMASGNLAAAGKAFDAALKLVPRDSGLWVDIARLRYAGGEHVQSIEAAERAVALGPENVRALEFRGLLVRDQFGLAAALPWFEAGLKLRPDDVDLLGEYAATLGDLGRAREMLSVTRRMIELGPEDPRAFVLQGILAARAGNIDLARSLLARAGPRSDDVPARLLLQGILELKTGNVNQAADLFDRLSRLQPRNRTARLLLARAMDASGDRRLLVETFAADVRSADASPYVLTLVGRALEDLGERERAAPLLDRAARGGGQGFVPLGEVMPLAVPGQRSASAPGEVAAAAAHARGLVGAGQITQAAAIAERAGALMPGSADAQVLLGDARMMQDNPSAASEAWRKAAMVRLSDDLMLRLVDVYLRAGQGGEAERVVRAVLAASPRNRPALRLAAGFAAARGRWGECAGLLGYLVQTGSAGDAALQADLALARLKAGDPSGAGAAASAAGALQRASGGVAEARARVLMRTNRPLSDGLMRKAGAMGLPG